MRVLITGARLPATLALTRALAAAGAECTVADSLRVTGAGCSRFAARSLHLPSPSSSLESFRAAMLAAVRKFRIELVVPMSEEVFYLAMIEQDLAKVGATLFAPPLSLLRNLHSKWEVLEAAESCGFLLPRTLLVNSAKSFTEAVNEIPQGVLKAEFSRGAFGTVFLSEPLPFQPEISERQRWVVQERVTGRELSVYLVAREGETRAFACYEPRYRAGLGASLFFAPATCVPAESAARAFARKFRFTGQLAFDLIEESGGGVALLECNPRATSGIHLCASAAAAAILNEEPPAMEAPRPHAAKLAVLALHAAAAFREGRLGALSYADLDRLSARYASLLRTRGAGPGARVALLARRSPELLAAELGILRAGACLVPLDPEWPAARIAFALKDSAPVCVLTEEELAPLTRGHRQAFPSETSFPPGPDSDPRDPAYLMYTSGSTGQPKGVLVGQRSLANYLLWAREAYHPGRAPVYPLFTSLAFDLTLTALLVPLVSGGEVRVFPENAPARCARSISRDPQVNALKLTPSHLRLLVEHGLGGAKVLVVGGEALDRELALRAAAGGALPGPDVSLHLAGFDSLQLALLLTRAAKLLPEASRDELFVDLHLFLRNPTLAALSAHLRALGASG